MKTYFLIIKLSQNLLLGISIIILTILPGILLLYPDTLDKNLLYLLAHTSLFLVMIIRPLADLFSQTNLVRPLVILRKGMGVFSASIIVSFIITKIILDPSGYLASLGTVDYWSLDNFSLFAHLADISAVLLLITSNNLSKKLLGSNWKRIQKLSYVYFYGSGLYVFLTQQDYLVLIYLIVVTHLTILAYRKNRLKQLTTNLNTD